MIEVVAVDGFKLSMCGDYHETLLWVECWGSELFQKLLGLVDADEIVLHESGDGQLVEAKSQASVSDETVAELRSLVGLRAVKRLAPVLPVPSRKGMSVWLR